MFDIIFVTASAKKSSNKFEIVWYLLILLNCENIVGYFHRLYKKKREKEGEFRITLFSFWFAFVTQLYDVNSCMYGAWFYAPLSVQLRESGRQRIQLGLRRPCKNIRSGINRRCLPACLLADALIARRFPVREPHV